MANELIWHDMLTEEKQQPYLPNTLQIVASERQPGVTAYPPQRDVFNAFRFTELGDVKAATLGQDPYHGSGQVHGLTFSICPGIVTPSSLLNMYKELENTIPDFTRPNHGYLESWVHQGALLLNTVLMVRAGQAYSRASLGQETLTDKIISLINQHREGVMFLLWGSYVQKRRAIIDKQRHHVLKTPCPSPLPTHRGLFGCNHFALANQRLGQYGETSIDWMPILPAESE